MIHRKHSEKSDAAFKEWYSEWSRNNLALHDRIAIRANGDDWHVQARGNGFYVVASLTRGNIQVNGWCPVFNHVFFSDIEEGWLL